MPTVSVIIPAYNAARYLDQAISSVLEQTYHDFEIILVDDGSTDNTLQVAGRYAVHLKVVSLANHGPSAARNVGIQMAVGEYLAFLDADDLLLPNKLEVQVSYLDRHPEIDVVYSNGYCFWKADNGTQTRRSFIQQRLLNPELGGPEDSLPLLAIQNAFPIHAALARRKAIVEVGGFDENLFGREDWDLWLRVAINHSFTYLDEIVALYRQGNMSVTAQSERQARAVQVIGSKVECSDWFKSFPAKVRSRFYLSRGVQELEYSQTQAAMRYFRQALNSYPRNYPAWAALLAARVFGKRAVELYYFKRRLQGTQISRLDAIE